MIDDSVAACRVPLTTEWQVANGKCLLIMGHDSHLVTGQVTAGSGSASHLGFPTVNVAYQALPQGARSGVYAAELVVDERSFPGVACLGAGMVNGQPKLEIHCFQSVSMRPGDAVRCRLLAFQRELVAYQNDEQMRRLIAGDLEEAKGYFSL